MIISGYHGHDIMQISTERLSPAMCARVEIVLLNLIFFLSFLYSFINYITLSVSYLAIGSILLITVAYEKSFSKLLYIKKKLISI